MDIRGGGEQAPRLGRKPAGNPWPAQIAPATADTASMPAPEAMKTDLRLRRGPAGLRNGRSIQYQEAAPAASDAAMRTIARGVAGSPDTTLSKTMIGQCQT